MSSLRSAFLYWFIRVMTVLVCAWFGTGAVAAECSAPVGRDFPSASLASSKLSAGPLIKFIQDVDQGGFDIRSLLILQGCQVLFERYKKGIERDDAHSLYGTTVAVTSVLIGRLLQEKHIKSIDEPLATLIKRPPGVADSDWAKLQSIKLVDALRMRSGLKWTPGGINGVHGPEFDMLREGLKLQVAEPSGTKMVYSDFDAALAGFAAGD